MVGWLFLIALATGLSLAVARVSPADIGARFVRFYAGWAAALFVTAGGLRFFTGEPAGPAPSIAAGLAALAGLASAVLFTRGLNAGARASLLAAAGAGAAALALAAGGMPKVSEAGPAAVAVTAASWLTAAAVLGFLTNAMLVGHQFLQQPNIPLRVLQDQTVGLIAALVARLFSAGAALAVHWSTVLANLGPIPEWPTHLHGVYLCVRLIVGLLLPLGFSYMVWQTVRIRSTQSATGILYGVLIFVFLGELTAFLIFRAHGIPV